MPEEAVQPDAGAAVAADAPAPEAAAPAAETTTPSGVPEEYQDRFTDAGWKEYTDLRHENADYRQRWSSYEDAFGRLDPEVAQSFVGLANYMAQNPYEAAGALGQFYDAYGRSVGYDPALPYAQQQQYPVDPGYGYEQQQYFDPSQTPVTQADLAQWAAEQQSYAESQNIQGYIVSRAAQLGFDASTNPEGYDRLLTRAFHMTPPGGMADLDAAAETLRNEESRAREQWQREFLASKQRDAAGMTVAPSDGGSPTGARQIHNLKDSFGALAARLAASNEVPR